MTGISKRRRPRASLDWLAGADPGLMRLRFATEIVITMGVVMVAEWGFVRGVGVLQVPVPSAPASLVLKVLAANHSMTVIPMLLGGLAVLMAGLTLGLYPTVRSQLMTVASAPVFVLAGLAAGWSLHARALSLALMVAVMAAGVYARRFGPRGFDGAVQAFIGLFFGFTLRDMLPIGDFGWLAADVALGFTAMSVVHFALFWPRSAADLRRMQRSFAARARIVAGDAAEMFGTVNGSREHERHQRAERRLRRKLHRLNEAALLIDARLGNPAAVPAGWDAAALHQAVFGIEVALGNIARFALAIAGRQLPATVTAAIEGALESIRDGDLPGELTGVQEMRDLEAARDHELTPQDRVLVHRFVTSVTDLSAGLRSFRSGRLAGEAFRPQVLTFGGWLPGSALVSRAASGERGGTGLTGRILLAPHARMAIQLAVAATAAIIAGDALSGRRFYWALIAALIAFVGVNTSGEQVRKGLFRVIGTLVGVAAGSVLGHLVGDRVGLQVVVILAAMFLGMYLSQVNYTFTTIGITVMVSQIYVELGEFSTSLMVLRLEETAIGGGIVVATALLVLPLRTCRVARIAARQQLEALSDLAGRCLDRLADPGASGGSDLELRAAARRADAAQQALAAAVRPLAGRSASRAAGLTAIMAAATSHTRTVILDIGRGSGLGPGAAAELELARRQLTDSVAAISAAMYPVGSGGTGSYVRSASLFEDVSDMLPRQHFPSHPQLALHELQQLDGALAEAARWAGVRVTDLDTASPRPVPGR
jgi:uncharacterized membrane protein YccC